MAGRAQKMAERRERILEAAREIIAEGGLEALTTRALAERAQVTVPTVYNLVGAKDQVLFAAVEDQTARFLAALGSHSEEPPATRAISVCRACVTELIRAPHYYRAILLLMHASDAGAEVRRAVGRTVVEELEKATRALAATGDLADWITPRSLAERMGVALTATALQWATGDLPDAELERTAALGAALLLLGVTQGAARDAIEALARSQEQRPARRQRAAPQ